MVCAAPRVPSEAERYSTPALPPRAAKQLDSALTHGVLLNFSIHRPLVPVALPLYCWRPELSA
eukprot:3699634-Pleurochrysis_carterae.AAC.1